MKHTFYYFFHTCLFLCVTLTACTAKRSAIKAVSESETASVTESRLTFYRTIDSLSRQFCLSADSISIIFLNPGLTEFPTVYTSKMIGCTETPSALDTNNFTSQADERPQIASRPRNALRSANASPSSQVPSPILIPQSLKVYGLHLNDNIEKKSIDSADLKDSVNKFTQSRIDKSAYKQSSKPSSTPKYIFYILVLLIILWVIWKLRS